MAEPVVLTSTESLIAFAEREYLSALTLHAAKPKPAAAGKTGRPPRTVQFTWRLDTPGAVVPYKVVAEGVRRWSLDGAHDDGELSWTADPAADAPIAIVMEVPGQLRLACERMTITRGRPTRKKQAVRPLSAYTYVTVDGVGTPSLDVLTRALSDEPDVALFTGAAPATDPLASGAHILRRESREVARVFFSAARAGGWLSIGRGDGATDDEWRRCLHAPRALPSAQVAGPWEFFGSAAEWLALLARLP